MPTARLEHVNVPVSDPRGAADLLCRLFGWHVRWEGADTLGGHTVHVGTDDNYVALHARPAGTPPAPAGGRLNHIGIVVDDLDAVEASVAAAGYRPHSHHDYAPGRRFYFNDADDIEYEVVSYS
jgi:catechol 2,3-dioxygenase-like lactoylglutathione lyase family enzyme